MLNDVVLDQLDDAHSHIRRFLLWPKLWQQFNVNVAAFAWQEHEFNEAEMTNIPNMPGVYTFVIKPGVANHPSCSYLVYVGQTSKQTLSIRFKQYLDEQAGKGKPRINMFRILNKYKNYLYFVCMPTDKKTLPKKIEDELLKAFCPPCNDPDTFPAEVRHIKGAFV